MKTGKGTPSEGKPARRRRKAAPSPGTEGPSAERFDAQRFHEESRAGGGGGGGAAPADLAPRSTTLNHDGSRLGSAPGYGGVNPTGGDGQLYHHGHFDYAVPDEQPIGTPDDVILASEGQRREQHPGIAGAPAPSDYGTSGNLDYDPGNIGMGEEF